MAVDKRVLSTCGLLAFLLLFAVNFQAKAGEEAEQVIYADTGETVLGDALPARNPFTVTVDVREEYDDNIYTSADNKKESFQTFVSPSLIYNTPKGEETSASLRYTFTGVYYSDRPDDEFEMRHEFAARVSHSFSPRFNIDFRERFRFTDEPEIFDSGSTLQRSGEYLNNTASIQFNAQWTPRFGQVVAYTNDIYDYDDPFVGFVNDRMSHYFNNDFRFLVLPTLSVVGGISMNFIDYENIDRDLITYTPTVGFDWSISPTLTLSGRVGAQVAVLDNSNSDNTEVSPYGSLVLDWVLGARSGFNFDYSFSLTETDIGSEFAAQTHRFGSNFYYQITPEFRTTLRGFIAFNAYNNQYSTLPGTVTDFDEQVAGAGVDFSYEVLQYMDVNWGYTFTTVESDITSREYDRNRVYIGLRGVY